MEPTGAYRPESADAGLSVGCCFESCVAPLTGAHPFGIALAWSNPR